MISSKDNEKVKLIKNLYTSKGRKENNLFIVEGPHLVKEAKKANLLQEAFTCDENLEGTLIKEDILRKIVKTDTLVKQIAICKIKENAKEVSGKVLILDQIQDPGNMGTLLRTAKAFSFDSVFLADGCVDIYNDKVIRSSQGAIFKLNFYKGNKIEFINKLKNEGYNVYSTNVRNGMDVRKIEAKDDIALILGNEGNGVSKEINDLNLSNIYIEMDNTESLNVSVAGAILMYELSK